MFVCRPLRAVRYDMLPMMRLCLMFDEHVALLFSLPVRYSFVALPRFICREICRNTYGSPLLSKLYICRVYALMLYHARYRGC